MSHHDLNPQPGLPLKAGWMDGSRWGWANRPKDFKPKDMVDGKATEDLSCWSGTDTSCCRLAFSVSRVLGVAVEMVSFLLVFWYEPPRKALHVSCRCGSRPVPVVDPLFARIAVMVGEIYVGRII